MKLKVNSLQSILIYVIVCVGNFSAINETPTPRLHKHLNEWAKKYIWKYQLIFVFVCLMFVVSCFRFLLAVVWWVSTAVCLSSLPAFQIVFLLKIYLSQFFPLHIHYRLRYIFSHGIVIYTTFGNWIWISHIYPTRCLRDLFCIWCIIQYVCRWKIYEGNRRF